jgi:hypothetical protein
MLVTWRERDKTMIGTVLNHTKAICIIVVSVRELIPRANDRNSNWDVYDEVYHDQSPGEHLDVPGPRERGLGARIPACTCAAACGMEEERDGCDIQYAEDEEGVGGIEVQISIHPVRGRPMSNSFPPCMCLFWGGTRMRRIQRTEQNKEWMVRRTDD